MNRATRFIILSAFVLFSNISCAQILAGKVFTITDSGDTTAVYMARLQWLHTSIGAYSDVDGSFLIPRSDLTDTLIVSYYFYTPDTLIISKTQDSIRIFISTTQSLQEVVVGKRNRQKYVRKDNPAVALIKNVIEHKDFNRVQNKEHYSFKKYKKRILALDKFDIDFNKNKLYKQFSFLQRYIDTSQFDSVPVLTVSLRETMSDNINRKSPKKHQQIITSERIQGIEDILENEGLATNIEAMFPEIDIFGNDIEIMLNHFVSPLSSSLAFAYYHYYITDTIDIDNAPCIEITFTPVNSRTFGFTGKLYVVNDGTFALKKYSINVPFNINMNFVSSLKIDQEFMKLDNGDWAPMNTNTFVKFYLFKKMRQIYARQNEFCYDYDVSSNIPDSLFAINDEEISMKNKKEIRSDEEWNEFRPYPLSGKESFIDSIMFELKRVPKFNAVIKTIEIIGSGYVSTSKERNNSFFDFGPIFNTISYNNLEGIRLRIGGMTTANLSKHWFFNGYIALGIKDLRMKYNATIIHSFVPKDYHPYESLRHALYLSTYYDVEVPGQSYAFIDRDNVFMSFNIGTPLRAMQYVRRTKLRYEKEWANRLSIDTWLQHENIEAAGTLAFNRINSDGSTSKVKYFNAFELSAQLRWAPGEPLYNNRLGKESPFNLAKDAPIIRITHTIGVMDFKFWYNKTEISAEKRFWLSSFGHIDVMLQTGIIWNKVPFPKLYIPQSNQSLFLTPNTFNLMKPMEFVMDQYIGLYMTYYLKGWIFNRIPLWNRLKLREVVSFNGIYGGLSPKNTPTNSNVGLYQLPDGCSPIGKIPYLELTAGVENILKFIRIDYVRRLTYSKDLKGWQKNGIRFTFRISL